MPDIPFRVAGEVAITPPLTFDEYQDSPLDPAGTGVLHLVIREERISTPAGVMLRESGVAIRWSGLTLLAGRGSTTQAIQTALAYAMSVWPDREYTGHLQCSRGTDAWRIVPRRGDGEHWQADHVKPLTVWPHDPGHEQELARLLLDLGISAYLPVRVSAEEAERDAMRAARRLIAAFRDRAPESWATSGALASYLAEAAAL